MPQPLALLLPLTSPVCGQQRGLMVEVFMLLIGFKFCIIRTGGIYSRSIIKIHRNNLSNKLHGISFELRFGIPFNSEIECVMLFFFSFHSILASLSLTKTKQIFVDHLKWVWCIRRQHISYYMWNVCAAVSIGKICAQKVSNLFRSKTNKTDRI